MVEKNEEWTEIAEKNSRSRDRETPFRLPFQFWLEKYIRMKKKEAVQNKMIWVEIGRLYAASRTATTRHPEREKILP